MPPPRLQDEAVDVQLASVFYVGRALNTYASPRRIFTKHAILQRVGKEVAIGEVAEGSLHLLLRVHLDLLGPFPILAKPPQRTSPRPGPEPPLRGLKNQVAHWWNGVFLGLETRGCSMVSNAVPDPQVTNFPARSRQMQSIWPASRSEQLKMLSSVRSTEELGMMTLS